TYGALLKVALLTAQRFHKVVEMRRGDFKDHLIVEEYRDEVTDAWVPEARIDDVWDPTRRNDPKNKGVSLVPLSPMARTILDDLPVIDAEEGWVFTLNGDQPMRGFAKFKARLDQAMLAHMRQQAKKRGDDPKKVKLDPWQHRDLRRTARTLM